MAENLFTKTHIIREWSHRRASATSAQEAFYALAFNILKSATHGKTLKSGKPTYYHSVHLAHSPNLTPTQRIIALLHDVIEDSRKNNQEQHWTLQDLRDLGFSEHIIKCVDALTHRPGEPYFDFTQRIAGEGGRDAIAVKKLDIGHNSQNERYAHLMPPKEIDRFDKYNVCYFWLDAVQKGMSPQTAFADFMKATPAYRDHPQRANELLTLFSSEPARLSAAPHKQIWYKMSGRLTKTFVPHARGMHTLSPVTVQDVSRVMYDSEKARLALRAACKTRQNNIKAEGPHFLTASHVAAMNRHNIFFYYLTAHTKPNGARSLETDVPYIDIQKAPSVFHFAQQSGFYGQEAGRIRSLISGRTTPALFMDEALIRQ